MWQANVLWGWRTRMWRTVLPVKEADQLKCVEQPSPAQLTEDFRFVTSLIPQPFVMKGKCVRAQMTGSESVEIHHTQCAKPHSTYPDNPELWCRIHFQWVAVQSPHFPHKQQRTERALLQSKERGETILRSQKAGEVEARWGKATRAMKPEDMKGRVTSGHLWIPCATPHPPPKGIKDLPHTTLKVRRILSRRLSS